MREVEGAIWRTPSAAKAGIATSGSAAEASAADTASRLQRGAGGEGRDWRPA